MVKFLKIFIGEAKNTVAMCKTLMQDVAEAVAKQGGVFCGS